MSKILIHSIAFSPDGVSTAYLYNDIALKFKESGYDVIVLTTTPHYNVVPEMLEKQPLKRKWLGLYYYSEFSGITVKHVYQKKFKSSLLRMIGFVYWHFMSLILGLFEKNVDVILSPSPPLTIGLINCILGKIKRAKVVYNVQEIYPDLLINEGKLKSRLGISILKYLEKVVYNKSDMVLTIDKIFYQTIVGRIKQKEKLHIVPNFVDTSIYHPISDLSLIDQLPFFPKTNSLKLMYAGNIGHAQDWKTLVELAKKLKNDNIDFFVIGEGVMKDFLKQEIIKYKLERIHLIPYQPRYLMPSIIAYADLHFIFMTPHTEKQGFPSKVYTIMACSKSILVCSGAETPIVNFLSEKNCAFLIEKKKLNEKTDAIVQILRSVNKDDLVKMGNNGMKDINENYSKEVVTNMYFNLIESIITHR